MRQHRFTQDVVDEVRIRVLLNWLRTCDEKGWFPAPVMHMWFPKPDNAEYEMRHGNAPPDADRPKHLRRLRLEIDANAAPNWLRNMTRRGGDIEQYINEQIEEQGLYADSHAIWVAAVKAFAAKLTQEKREEILWGRLRQREQERERNESHLVVATQTLEKPTLIVPPYSSNFLLSARTSGR